MPPTPEQLQIDINQNLQPQATQVAPSIIDPSNTAAVTKEGEVSMPAPQQWIGPIDYGMNWYALGSAAFKVAGDVYEKVLDYNVQKKVGQIEDVQFDLETKMRNSYAESLSKPENNSTTPTIDNYSKPFENSDKFQQEYIERTNEILGIGSRDENGKYIDVFQPEYNLDGLGTKYIQAVTLARSGLRNIATTSQKVQNDLLRVHQKNYEISSIKNNYFNGEPLSTAANKKLDEEGSLRPFSQQGTRLPDTMFITINSKTNIASNGEPVILQGDGWQALNPKATKTELLREMGEEKFTELMDMEAKIWGSSRGLTILPSAADNISTTLKSPNPSPAQLIELNSAMKVLSLDKVKSLLTANTDYTPTETARLWRSWDMSQALEPSTPIQFRDELNKITQPTASEVMAMVNLIQGKYISTDPTIMNSLRSNPQRLLTVSAVYKTMINKTGPEDDADVAARTSDSRILQQELANNPALMPALINNLLIYEGVYQNNPANEKAALAAVQNLGDDIIKDSNGKFYVPRIKGTANKFFNTRTKTYDLYASDIKKQAENRVSIDPIFKQELNKKLLSGQQITFQYGSLQDTIEEKAVPLYVEAIDNSGFVKLNSPNLLTTEARLGIVNSSRSISTNGTSNLSEPITQGELFRVLIATNPAVQKKFNGGIAPKTIEEATVASRKAYLNLGQAEYWSWDDIHNSSKDSFVNSEMGGVSFDLSKLTFQNSDTGLNENILQDSNVVYPSSAMRLQFTNQTTGNPLAFISNINLRSPGYDEEILSNFKNSMRYGKSKHMEINTGTNKTTSNKDVGIESALEHMTVTTQDEYNSISHDIIMNISDMDTVNRLTQQVTTSQATNAILDPAFLNTVALSLNNTYGIPQDTANKILYTVVQNNDLKYRIVNRDVDGDGKLTKLDLFSSLHNAVIGYKQNKLEKKPMEFQNMADVYWKDSRSMLGPDGNSGIDIQNTNVYGSNVYSSQPEPSLVDEFKKRQSLKYKVNLGLTPQNNFQPSGDPNVSTTPTSTPVVTPNVSNSDIDTNWGSMLTPKQKEIQWSNSPEGQEILNTFWSGLLKPDTSVDMEMDLTAEVDAARVKAGMRPDQREERQVQKIKQMILDGGDEKNRDPITFKKVNKTSPGAVRGSKANDLISEYEGLKTTAYYDEDGKVWTIGKGTTKYEDGTPVKQGDKITKEKANQLMESYIENKVIPTLEKTIPTWGELDQNQRDALISFAYNVGPNFYGAKDFETITKELSSVDTLERVSAALKLYNKSKGKVLNGLIKRRKAEGDLWNAVVK